MGAPCAGGFQKRPRAADGRGGGGSEGCGSAMVDYSVWDHIEVSDDEDETHPNIDTASLFRWRHQVGRGPASGPGSALRPRCHGDRAPLPVAVAMPPFPPLPLFPIGPPRCPVGMRCLRCRGYRCPPPKGPQPLLGAPHLCMAGSSSASQPRPHGRPHFVPPPSQGCCHGGPHSLPRLVPFGVFSPLPVGVPRAAPLPPPTPPAVPISSPH